MGRHNLWPGTKPGRISQLKEFRRDGTILTPARQCPG